VKQESWQRAIAHVASHGDTDVFPFPVENHIFHDQPAEVVEVLEGTHANFEAELNADATQGVSAMAPVGYTGFRWATQLDPIWNAYLLALVIELAPSIEAARVDDSVVHSHRYAGEPSDSEIFNRDGYLAFERAGAVTAEDNDWVVVTDIADFYPRVYHHRLENALAEVSGGSDLPDRIMRLLNRWSNNTSYGLPVGGPAARLLSELVLNRTDKLLQLRDRPFHRYADDYRLFASSKQDAHRALADLSELLLRNEGLALSKAKTRIMSRAEFLSTLDRDPDRDDAEEDLSTEQVDRRRRARELLGLTLRYDPYSPTSVADYEALKAAVERIDIVDLFMVELSKPRIDPRLTRRLLRALDAAESSAKGRVCTSLLQNLELLAPLVPQVMQAVRRVLMDIDATLSQESRRMLSRQLSEGSHIFDLGVNRAFALRVLADDPDRTFEAQLAGAFEASPPFIQRDIVLAMARWRASYWLSDRKTHFDSLHPLVKRAFLMASYYLGDEGNHWRRSIRTRLSPYDEVVRDWAAARAPLATWEIPL
jgi:hypothetical protein